MLSRRAAGGGVDDSLMGEAGAFGHLGKYRLDAGFTYEGASKIFGDTVEELQGRGIDPFHDKGAGDGGGKPGADAAALRDAAKSIQGAAGDLRGVMKNRPLVKPRDGAAGRAP
jgi:hypothetical protein